MLRTITTERGSKYISYLIWRTVSRKVDEAIPSDHLGCDGMTLSTRRERSGSVVECLTRDRRAAGSSLAGVTALCP